MPPICVPPQPPTDSPHCPPADSPQYSPQYRFNYVSELSSDFLALFPHRGDYLWAEHCGPEARPVWRTESRHLLGDRQILQGSRLFGVRFGPETRYLMLDLDPTSAYHPQQDEFAIPRIMDALEPLGLVSYLAVTSSYRGGLHLYLPFQQSQPSWKIALVAQTLLKHAGFISAAGQLELFPNPRSYSPTQLALYSGHRLPLQVGSYLLNGALEPTAGQSNQFVAQWQHVQQRNTLDLRLLNRVLKQAKVAQYRISGNAQKFLQDLDAEIEPGWTGVGQTNRLLGRIAMREYVFRHVISGGDALTGHRLAEAISCIARDLPGYADYCNHQADLEARAEEWARCVEESGRYYPYGGMALSPPGRARPPSPETSESPSWNQQQAEAARERIRGAVADLLNLGQLPAQATARQQAIRGYGIGNTTLEKNRDLWHPEFLNPPSEEEYHPIPDSDLDSESLKPLRDSQYHPIKHNKLFCFFFSGPMFDQVVFRRLILFLRDFRFY